MTTESSKTTLTQKITKVLLDGGVIIAISTALLYIIGRAVDIGFGQYWGISLNVFTSSFRETIYLGFLILNLQTAVLIIKWWLVVLVIFLSFWFFLFKFSPSIQERIKGVEPFEFKKRPEWYERMSKRFDRWYTFFTFTSLFILLFAVLTTGFIEIGKKTAEKTHVSYKHLTSNKLMTKDGVDFYTIGCSGDICAVFFPENDEIKYVDSKWLIGSTKNIYTNKNVQKDLDEKGNRN